MTSGIPVFYDFTASASQAYGDNQNSAGNNYVIYTGDVNLDGFVDGMDLMVIANDNDQFMMGYLVTDINGDGFVDGMDLMTTDNNNEMFVDVITPPCTGVPIEPGPALLASGSDWIHWSWFSVPGAEGYSFSDQNDF